MQNSVCQLNTDIDNLYKTDINTGLTVNEIDERIKEGKINGVIDVPTKSIGQILWTNLFTLFNILNVILGILVISVGSYKNALFMGIVVSNTLISLVQEIKAKRTVDKLSLISAPKARVVRNSNIESIAIKDVLLDDIMILEAGNQICADSIVVSGEMEVNESLLTGESDAVLKGVGDKLMSGSYVISGYAKAQVTCIGKDNYASRISAGAKYIKRINSEILRSVKNIIRFMTIIIIPLGIIIFYKQYNTLNSYSEAIVKTVASMVSMIPEGLVLLTTTVFAVSVVKLAKHNTLVQDLYCIETLARVDVLCLDKTGTITEGKMQVDELICFSDNDEEVVTILSAMMYSLKDNNPTAIALREQYNHNPEWEFNYVVPFSSSRKWSGVRFNDFSYAIGAGEFMLQERYREISTLVEKYSNQGKRVLTLVRSKDDIKGDLSTDVEVLAIVLLSDKIREEAHETLKFFHDEGVEIKIISGDNPITASQIAERAGVINYDKYIDAATLKTEEDIFRALLEYTVFGRVTPEQKLEIIKQLKNQGRTVGMTGDGVNDVLALKEADCSIAMASGSDAARNVSSLVLLDNNFASMPRVVAEGRKSINNLQRSSSLFLIKTIYATLLAIIFVFVKWVYPFEAIQLTLVSALAVATPSLVLALEPNYERIKGHFIQNAIYKALPSSLSVVFILVSMLILSNLSFIDVPREGQSTLATILLGGVMFIVLFRICKPFNTMRTTLFVLCSSAFTLAIIALPDLFSLTKMTREMLIVAIPLFILTYPIMLLSGMLTKTLIEKYNIRILDRLLDATKALSRPLDRINKMANGKNKNSDKISKDSDKN